MPDSTRKVELNIPGIAFITIIVLVFLFVWPGPFRYVYKLGTTPAKVDRISGTIFLLTGTGWKPVAANFNGKRLPEAQLSDVHAKETASDYPLSRYNIYNGSSWTVSEIIFKVKTGTLTRLYRAKPKSPIEPLSTGNVSFTLDNEMLDNISDSGYFSKTSIDSVKGYPSD